MSTPHNWTFDADLGIYKNHALSDDLLEVAIAETIILPFTEMVESFGKGKGETINIMHVKELPEPADARLNEFTRVPIDKLTLGTRSLTVAEWGRGVEYSDLARQLGKFDPKTYLQKRLKNQMKGVVDTAAAAAFLNSDVKMVFTPTGPAAGTWSTTGAAGAVALSPLTFDHMGIIRDYITASLHIPAFEGNDWIAIFPPKNMRGLRSDRLFQELHMYLGKGDFFFNGEIGKAEGIRLVECNRENAFSNVGSGSATVIGEGVIFGDEAIARVEVMAPELRVSVNYQDDFGRKGAVAWIGIFVFGAFWNTSNDGEAKIIKILSL
jgi:N4-gp56 family major capsid protein